MIKGLKDIRIRTIEIIEKSSKERRPYVSDPKTHNIEESYIQLIKQEYIKNVQEDPQW